MTVQNLTGIENNLGVAQGHQIVMLGETHYSCTSHGFTYNLHVKWNHPIEITQGMDEDQKNVG